MFTIWKKQNKLKLLQQHRQLSNDIPFRILLKVPFYVNFLWSLKLDIFKTKLTSIKIGEIIAPYLLYWMKKKFFLATFCERAKILSQRQGTKKFQRKFSTANFVLKSSSYLYLTLKMDSLGQKMVKYLFSLWKSFKVKSYYQNWLWEMKKWLCSPLKIHLVGKNSKCCILAIGKDI